MRGKLGLRSRFVPFSPADVAGLTGWWDASDSSTLFDATSGGSAVAADGGVARLEDKSGAGRHFTQSTSGARPLRKTAVRNSLDVLRFDGSDDWLDSTIGFSALFTSTATTCFIVAKATNIAWDDTDWSVNQMVLSESLGAQAFFVVRSNSTVRSVGYSFAFTQVSDSYTAGNWIVLSTWHDGSDLSVAVNGGATQSGSLFTRTFLGDMRVGTNSSANKFFDGDVGEIITYNQSLSAQDREDVESALMSKWAIS
jgi:hypothetical protein